MLSSSRYNLNQEFSGAGTSRDAVPHFFPGRCSVTHYFTNIRQNNNSKLSGPGNAHVISGRQMASDAGRIVPRLPPPVAVAAAALAPAVCRKGDSL